MQACIKHKEVTKARIGNSCGKSNGGKSNSGGKSGSKQGEQQGGQRRQQGQQQSLEDLVEEVLRRWTQEESQGQMRGENEARRESERNRDRWHEGKGSQAALFGEKGEMRWDNGKGKGKVSDGGRSGKIVKLEGEGWSMADGGRHRRDERLVRSEEERQDTIEDQKTWEDWWSMKEKRWVESEWE